MTSRRQLRLPRPEFLLPVWGLTLVALLAGCLSRPALVHQTFALHPTTTSTNTNAGAHGIVALRTVQVSPLFEGRRFIYRVGPNAYEADPYAEFLVPPSRALAIPIRACLRDSGLFQNVLEPGTQLEADTVLEVQARELYGDFRNREAPAAVLDLRLSLFESGGAPEPLLQKDYARRMALSEATAAALVAGWNHTLTEIMQEASADIAAARKHMAAR